MKPNGKVVRVNLRGFRVITTRGPLYQPEFAEGHTRVSVRSWFRGFPEAPNSEGLAFRAAQQAQLSDREI